MPADFGEITAYHHHEATRLNMLALAARDSGSMAEAEYLSNQAARWEEAAQEQKAAMQKQPTRSNTDQSPFFSLPEPPQIHPVIACLLAVLRGVQWIAASIRQFMARRSTAISSLSLR